MLAWVVPCFDEERRLDVGAFLELAATPGVYLHFVDDGSRDSTAQVLAGLCDRAAGKASWQQLAVNSGKSEAVRQGLLRMVADGHDVVGYLDADLSTPVAEAQRLAEMIAARPDVQVALGSRVLMLGSRIERTTLRHYLGRLFATAASATLGLPVYDTQCGAKLFRASAALQVALAEPFSSRWAFDVELLHRLLRLGVGVDEFLEVPLRAWRDVGGSKLKPTAMVRAAWDLLQLRRRR